MNKLKQNKGYTLSVVLVIMIVLGILTSSILFSVTFKTNTTNKIVQDSIEKIELEKVTYSYLNSVVTKEITLENFTIGDYSIIVEKDDVNEYIYTITVTSPSSKVLTTRISFEEEYTSYTILSWGVK